MRRRDGIPEPAIHRLCALHTTLQTLTGENGVERISSSELSSILNIQAHTIRKDINYLGEAGHFRAGYDCATLKSMIAANLHCNVERNMCIVGLGRLGAALLDYDGFAQTPFNIVAGFDISTNRLETLRTRVPLYPAFEMADVIRSKSVEIAILALPATAAGECAEKLIQYGIKGIINFSPAIIRTAHQGVHIVQMDLVSELLAISAMIGLHGKNNDQ